MNVSVARLWDNNPHPNGVCTEITWVNLYFHVCVYVRMCVCLLEQLYSLPCRLSDYSSWLCKVAKSHTSVKVRR